LSRPGYGAALSAWVRQSVLVAGLHYRFYHLRRQRRVRRALLENLFVRRRAFLDVEGIETGGLPRLEAFLLLQRLDAASGRVLYSPDLRLDDQPDSFFSGYLQAAGDEALRQGMLCSRLARRRYFLPAYLNSFLVLALILGAAMAAASPFFARIFLTALPFLAIPLVLLHGRGLFPLQALATMLGILLIRFWRGLQFLRGLFTK
jgi:hypothetical protein